jgi:hypothetical protein
LPLTAHPCSQKQRRHLTDVERAHIKYEGLRALERAIDLCTAELTKMTRLRDLARDPDSLNDRPTRSEWGAICEYFDEAYMQGAVGDLTDEIAELLERAARALGGYSGHAIALTEVVSPLPASEEVSATNVVWAWPRFVVQMIADGELDQPDSRTAEIGA